jgi:N-acetyl-1-D-myo-inositol-2-amino-2-deoxy-alpha-D-glucopyranoside deacetylase
MNHPPTLMIVHAHPDDEVIGTGGTFVLYRERGVRTILVTATLGDEGEIVDPKLNTPENKANLPALRREELARAVEILRIGRLELLGYRDSGMAGMASNQHPDSFNMADPDEAAARLVRLVRAHRPHVLVSYNANGGYGHPDHIACHKATLAAWEAAGDPQRYPEAGPPWTPLKLYETAAPRERWQRMFELMRSHGFPTPLDRPDFPLELFTVPEAQVTTSIDVGAYLEHKRAALRVHRTQIAADGPFLSMPDELVRELNDREFFTLVAARVPLLPREGLEDDLFAGIG